LHHDSKSDLVEPDPYNFRICGEKWYGYREKRTRGGGKKTSLQKTKQRRASIHFVTVC